MANLILPAIIGAVDMLWIGQLGGDSGDFCPWCFAVDGPCLIVATPRKIDKIDKSNRTETVTVVNYVS